MFSLPGCSTSRLEGSKPWAPGSGGAGGGLRAVEVDEETKKNQNIINIVREGQISLLVRLLAGLLSW